MSKTIGSLHRESSLLSKGYFPGLNELRAVAALCVIPGHIEQMKGLAGLPSNFWFPIPGKLGVILFFVLSGFLITSILFNERSATGRVDLKRFYIKRTLRIWPLYFLIIGASILVINRIAAFQIPFYSATLYEQLDLKNILLLLFILPNYVSLLIPYAAQSWSIGIEEQFYLVQPFIIKFANSISLLIGIMVVAIFSKELLLLANGEIDSALLVAIADQVEYFGCIAIGCFGALMCHEYPNLIRKIIHNPGVQFISFMVFIFFLVAIHKYGDEDVINMRFHAIVFLIFIVNAATNTKSPYNLKSKILDYLGKISYGLYMYHVIAIGCAIALARYFSDYLSRPLLLEVAVYSISLAVTIALSALSFRYFEGLFLGFKKRISG